MTAAFIAILRCCAAALVNECLSVAHNHNTAARKPLFDDTTVLVASSIERC